MAVDLAWRLSESQDLCNIISESRDLLISVQIGNNILQKDFGI